MKKLVLVLGAVIFVHCENLVTIPLTQNHETYISFSSNQDQGLLQATLATDLTLVTSKWCLACSFKIYDSTGSPTRKPGKYDLKQLTYTDQIINPSITIGLKGDSMRDRICPSNTTCKKDFEFFSITELNNAKSQFQGVLGLSADIKGGVRKSRESFGAFLKAEGYVDKHIVSLTYGELRNQVTFGGYQQQLLSPRDKKKSLVWHSMTQNQVFGYLTSLSTIKLSTSQFTRQSKPTQLLLSNTYPELRLYTSQPEVYYDFDDQITKIFPTVICKEDTQLLNLRCYLDYQNCKDVARQNLTFNIDSQMYTIGIDKLVLQDGNRCNILFGVSLRKDQGLDVLVAGQPLFQSYYVIIDFDKPQLALSGERTKLESEGSSAGGSSVGIILAIIFGILLLIAAAGCFLYIRKQRLKQRLAQYSEL